MSFTHKLYRSLSKISLRPRRKVFVVGTFRSGTNVTQHCFERFFYTRVVFNEWFWKHGVPPTEIKRNVPPRTPIVVMSKNPVDLNKSLYRFWTARRPELDVGKNISEFIRRRFIVYDNTSGNIRPKYYYLNPTEYWNQFYYSWLNYKEIEKQRVFLKCEDLMADPESNMAAIGHRFGLKRHGKRPVFIPEKRVGPNVPPPSRGGGDSLSDADIVWIRSQVDGEVAEALGYHDLK